MESRAAEHDRYALDLISHVADPFRHLSTRLEEIRKRHAEYAVKLEKERDAGYGDLKRTKGSYDNVCQEVENRRKKADSSFDYSKQKAQNAFQQHTSNMHNVKVRKLRATTVALTRPEQLPHPHQRHEQAKGKVLSRVPA